MVVQSLREVEVSHLSKAMVKGPQTTLELAEVCGLEAVQNWRDLADVFTVVGMAFKLQQCFR
jgi:hypothetical protein